MYPLPNSDTAYVCCDASDVSMPRSLDLLHHQLQAVMHGMFTVHRLTSEQM